MFSSQKNKLFDKKHELSDKKKTYLFEKRNKYFKKKYTDIFEHDATLLP